MKTNKPAKGVAEYRDKITSIFKATPWLTVAELAEKLNVPRDTAYWYLKVMRGEDLVRHRKRTPWAAGGNAPFEYSITAHVPNSHKVENKIRGPVGEQTKWAFPADVVKNRPAKPEAASDAAVIMVGVQVPINGKLVTLSVQDAETLYNSLKKVFHRS